MIDIEALADAIAERLQLPDERPLLSPKDVAGRLGVSERQARELINGNPSKGRPAKIRSLIVGDGARRVRPADLDAYLHEQEGAKRHLGERRARELAEEDLRDA